IERAGAAILEQLDCDACLLTQGQSGMSLFQRNAPVTHVPVVGSVEVTDVTGAGDTALALFAAAVAAGVGFGNAMRLANVAAGVVVMKVGAATALPHEIEEAARKGGVELLPW
ncbi:MAG: bifunctional heptose 7-phosphate kinase/heptose 1-phosphate adenyltransferase, partial [Deltaproteobacteria bacterium]|nr:bifunctional heptose 7-phosphate kinase/heptose 1-phosphate adenyltransferase [Deltaproteobacteria bacterium]